MQSFSLPPTRTWSMSSSAMREEVRTTETDVEVDVPEIIVVERLVEVPEIRFVEKLVPVVRREKRVRYVERQLPVEPVVHVPRPPLKVERLVARPVEVPVEVIIEKKIPIITEELVEIERIVPRFRVREVERQVTDYSQKPDVVYERNIHYENVIERKVPVIQEVVRHVPKIEYVEVVKEVPLVEYEDELVEVAAPPPLFRTVERFVEVPTIEFVDKFVDIPFPKIFNRIVEIAVEQKSRKFVERIVEQEVEQVVERLVHVPPPPVKISLPVERIRRIKLPPNSPFAAN